jgi:protein involved in polysaccharide export with SLBB domain
MKFVLSILILACVTTSCSTKSKTRLEQQNAFLAGQNAALRQQQTAQLAAQFPVVTIIGAVQNSSVPWVSGLTLAQAIATANYLDSKEPEEIILTRQGESATLPPKVLLDGTSIPLEPGDVVEIR